jgi:hypothetical protein
VWRPGNGARGRWSGSSTDGQRPSGVSRKRWGRAVRAGGGQGVAEALGGWAEIVCARGHLSGLSENGGTRPHVGVKSPRFVSL